MTRQTPLIIGGSANPDLAERIAGLLQLPLSRVIMERFPDGEVHMELLESPRRRNVVLVQPTGLPPDEHLFELLALADACRRGGASHITAVIPYFGYARQDRRARGIEPVTARLVADLIATSGVQQVLTVDIHTDAIEGFFAIPMERLTAVPVLAHAIGRCLPADGVVVSPDIGGARLAEKYARLWDLPTAIVRKKRIGGETVVASGLTGDIRGRTPIIVDDMISTGGTI
jgi:ribose-phosphate pyrophosphokinase